MCNSPQFETAAVLASHGDRAGREPNYALMFHADAVRALTGMRAVTAGVLKGAPTLEDAMQDAHDSGARDIVVYPLFMAEGYFTSSVLPARIRAAGFEAGSRILAPLGRDPGLADLLLSDALDTARRVRLNPRVSRLLVVGHGSKLGSASAEATREVAGRVRRATRFASVDTAFLEEAPFLEDELRAKRAPTIVCGFFFGDGMHAGEDVPAAIRETGARAVYTGPVGWSTRVATLIAARLRAEFKAKTH